MAAATAEKDLPPSHDWRTSDQDEILRRRLRAREGTFRIVNTDRRHAVLSTFAVQSGEDRRYVVEIRCASPREGVCDCVDFRVNGLGTCKHVEAVWLYLERRARGELRGAARDGIRRFEVLADQEGGGLRLAIPEGATLPPVLRKWFVGGGELSPEIDPAEAVGRLRQLAADALPALRVSQEVDAWIEHRRRAEERRELRRQYELRVQSGEWPPQETLVPLFPYQREGMLHLAFTERALLADEMGLGKTIQGVAACALLHRLGQARRVLVVTPASLKAEWEEQIRRFTALPCHVVFGGRHRRLEFLRAMARQAADGDSAGAPFFVVMNYEQVVPDVVEINEWLRPEVVVLDEAQRIKNWNTKTALTIKRLKSRYAFVLTGTPIENRIDELRSLVDFLDPSVLGPLFRFNRDFYEFDDRGRPVGYRNLPLLYQRIRPLLLRRRKADVETELPPRTDQNRFVPMAEAQKKAYGGYEQEVMRLVQIAERRPLTEREQERMQIHLAMMRMVCDTTFILDHDDRTCPKLEELARILEDCRENGTQVIVFSEWERMLVLVRDWCREHGIDHAWHTGSVPQQKRRGEINRFKADPNCRAFLTTDAGATGLNLQNASVVVNCDLPWNPARFEQRIARAWRKNQTRNVTVVNLISENTIEHRMLDTLATKRAVAESVLDRPGSVESIPLRSGRQAMIERVRGLMGSVPAAGAVVTAADRARIEREALEERYRQDPSAAFARFASERLGAAVVACEERRPAGGGDPVVCVVVERDGDALRPRIEEVRRELGGLVGESDGGFVDGEETEVPKLEVLDRATYEAIERLIGAGLLAPTSAFVRPLSLSGAPTEPAPLSPEEKARQRGRLEKSRYALRRARVLGEAGFAEECRASLLIAALEAAGALAIRRRYPEATELGETFVAPYGRMWGEGLEAVRAMVRAADAPWLPVAAAVDRVLAAAEGAGAK